MIKPRCKVPKTGAAEPGSPKWCCRTKQKVPEHIKQVGYLAQTTAGATLLVLRAPSAETFDHVERVSKEVSTAGAGYRPLGRFCALPRFVYQGSSPRAGVGSIRADRPSRKSLFERLRISCIEALAPLWASRMHPREVCELDPRCRGDLDKVAQRCLGAGVFGSAGGI